MEVVDLGIDSEAKMDLAFQRGTCPEKGLCCRIRVESILHRLRILGLQAAQPTLVGLHSWGCGELSAARKGVC